MKKKRLLFITEDFPSGLNGTSVKTRNTLQLILEQEYCIDLFCFHFDEYEKHNLEHKNLNVYTSKSKRFNKMSLLYFFRLIDLLISFVPISIKRLYSLDLHALLLKHTKEKKYHKIIFDGYSTLQYVNLPDNTEKIYIDDEDFTDLFKQRFMFERQVVQKLFYFIEYIKSLFFEKIVFSKVDQIWAISSNTAQRLQRVSRKKTILMPTLIELKQQLLNKKSNTIIFTGSLDWKENIDGLRWFIDTHWQTILCHFPIAKLVIIGQGASLELKEYFRQKRNILYKGYVKDLKTEYKKAGLAIAPVRINAGIKVKILTYLSYGLPVVSTKKAALGLVSLEGLIVSKDSMFAKSIVFVLRNNLLKKYLSNKGHKNIKENYSRRQLQKFLRENI